MADITVKPYRVDPLAPGAELEGNVTVQPFSPPALDAGTPLEAPAPGNPYLSELQARHEAGVAPQAPANPYLQALEAQEQERKAAAAARVSQALKTNPDQFAARQRVARYLGYPVAAVEAMPDITERQAKLKQLQQDAGKSPVLEERYTHEDFARLAHDDSVSLGNVAEWFKSGAKYLVSHPDAKNTLMGDIGAGIYRASRGAAGVAQAGAEIAAVPLDYLEPDTIEQQAGWRGKMGGNPLRRLAEGFAKTGKDSEAVANYLSPPQKSIVGGGVSSGVQSLTQNVLTLPFWFVPGGQPAALGMMAGTTGGDAYQRAREQGLSPARALPYAASQAAVEYATEKIPLGNLIGGIKAGTPFFKQLAQQVGTEVPGEQLATVLQDMNDWAVLPENKNKPFSAYLAERPSAAAQTLIATVVGVGGNVTIGQAIQQLAGTQVEAANAQQDAQDIADLLNRVQQTKLAERSSEELKTLVQDLAENSEGAPTEVRFDARTLLDVLNQAGIDDVGMAQFLPSVLPQLQEAVTTGGEVKVPIGEFAALAKYGELTQPLLEHARVGENELSAFEAKAAGEETERLIKEYSERMGQEVGQGAEQRASVARVRDTLLDQLTSANRFTADVNETYATLASTFYASMANRLGVTPEELYQRYPLRIQAEGTQAPGLNSQARAVPHVTEQTDEATGLPLNSDGTVTVYHHTSPEAAQRIEQTGLLKAEAEPDVYVTTRKEADTGYGDTAVPIQVKPELLQIDDEFPDGRVDYRLSVGRPGGSLQVGVGEPAAAAPAKVSQGAADRLEQGGIPDDDLDFTRPDDDLDFTGAGSEAGRADRGAPGRGAGAGGSELPADQDRHTTVGGGPAARGWAGATGVRGTDGQPATVFRGAGTELSADHFQLESLGHSTGNPSSGLGVWFTVSESDAARYGEVSAYQLDIRNPKVIPVDKLPGFDSLEEAHRFREKLRKAGFDGIAVDMRHVGGPIHYVAFTPEQVILPQAAVPEVTELEGDFADLFKQGPRGTFSPSQLTISLLAKADLSTFLHETGHFFLEALADIAAQPNAPAGITNDMGAVLKWFGVPDLATWQGMTLDQKRKHHERFAESFEQYLFEGKAPSADLMPLFTKFKSWLKSVYRTLQDFARGREDLQLNDEVRGVFDRLLATDVQIDQAQAIHGMQPLFKDAASAGMSEEQFAAYQAQHAEEREQARDALSRRSLKNMQWATNARSRMLKKLQAQTKEKRKAVEAEVRAEVEQEPIYQAMRWLRKGEMTSPQGEQIKAEKGFRLNTEALAEMYPESMLGRPQLERLKGMTAANGLHPDMVASMFGFGSGDELVRTLIDAEPINSVIEGKTDQRLLERYGDLTTEAGMAEAADEAVHTEARGRFVAAELKALQEGASEQLQPVVDKELRKQERARTAAGRRTLRAANANVLVKAAKNFATNLVGSRRVRDLLAGPHVQAAARAAKQAESALARGDMDTATQAKRDQLVNHYLARETQRVTEEVRKGVEYLKRFDKDAVRKKLPLDYLDQIDKLLERVDLRQQSNAQIDRRAKLAAWIEAQTQQGIEPQIPEQLLEDARLESYRNMRVEDFRALLDTVRQIEHLGKLKDKLLTAKDDREREAIYNDIAANIESSRPNKSANTRSPTTKWDRAVAKAMSFGAAHVKVSAWARLFDGGKDGGAAWKYMVRPANEASDLQTSMRADATERVAQIEKAWHERKDLNVKRLVPGVFKAGDGARARGAIGSSFTFQEILGVALNTGNDGNLQRLMGGEGWTLTEVQTLLQALSQEDWTRIQKIWDTFEAYRPQIAQLERDVFGKEPDWVEPAEQQWQTADGQSVTVKGGYFPIKYDPNASIRAEEHADAESAKRQLQGAYSAATVRRGFVKSRAEEVTGRPLSYSLDTIHSALEDTIHYLAWQRWLIDMNRMLRSGSKVVETMHDKYGPLVVQQFKSWRDAIAEGETGIQTALDSMLGRLRQHTSFAGLAYNVVSASMQFLGATQSMVRVGTREFGQALAQYAMHPRLRAQEVRQKSKFMANRARTRWRDLNELTNAVRGQSRWHRNMMINGYVLMGFMQTQVDMPTWMAAYQKAIVAGAAEADAIAQADQAVADSQGSGRLSDLAAIQRGGPALKIFTGFYDFMNTALNLGVVQALSAQSKRKLVTDMLLLFTVPAVLGDMLKNALIPGGGEDDEDWVKIARKAIGSQISYLMGLFVIAREFGDAAKGLVGGEQMHDYKGPIGVRAISDAITFGQQARQGELDDAFRKAAINLVGDVAGIPSAQINRTINGIEALSEGETKNPAAVVLGHQKQ